LAGKVFFASDFHLGIDTDQTSRERELKIVRWLESIQREADAIYLLGDVFDFWFEYKRVIPKGFVRLLGKLAEIRDQGIPVYFFNGNHDMWMFRYFEEEFGIPIYRKPILLEIQGKTFLIGHGDGLGPGDHGYKFIKKVFANPVCQWLFARLHPNFGMSIANFWSGKSRDSHGGIPAYLGPEGEWLIQYANDKLDTTAVDFFVFGHRHLPIDFTLKNGKSRYINLGDWMNHFSYAVFDGKELKLEFFETPDGKIFGNALSK